MSSDVEERMRKQADLQEAYAKGLEAGRAEEKDHEGTQAVDASPTALDLEPALNECEAWRRVAVESNKAIDTYLRELMPGLPEHYGMPVDGIRRVVDHLVKTDWPKLIKEMQDIVEDRTHGRLVVGLLNGALVVGERTSAPPLFGPAAVDNISFQHSGCVMLSELIAAWDILHLKNTGDIGFCDFELALQQGGVDVCNDCAQEQPEEAEEKTDA